MIGRKHKEIRVNLTLEEEAAEYLAETAKAQGISRSKFINNLLNEFRENEFTHKLNQAAETLYDDYKNNTRLTEFSSEDMRGRK